MESSIGGMFSPLVNAIETSRFHLKHCECFYELQRDYQWGEFCFPLRGDSNLAEAWFGLLVVSGRSPMFSEDRKLWLFFFFFGVVDCVVLQTPLIQDRLECIL